MAITTTVPAGNHRCQPKIFDASQNHRDQPEILNQQGRELDRVVFSRIAGG
jgi:hypothetical protein